jgi:transposase
MHVTMPELDTYSRVEAARRLGVAAGTLKRWAAEGRGPRYARTGTVKGRAIYTAADLAAWLAEHKTAPRASAAR